MIKSEKLILTFTQLNKYFNNRELAVALWAIIIFIYVMINKSRRESVNAVIKSALDIKLVILYIVMIAYFVGSVFLLYKIGFWEKRLLKNTVIWFITSGVISCGKAIGSAKDYRYFKEEIKRNFKLVAVLEFILNLYSFSFIGEVILIPIMVIMVWMISMIDILPEYKNKESQFVGKVLKYIQSLLLIYILYHSVGEIITNFGSLRFIECTKDILLPIILSVMFIPCIYFICIYSSYEILFIQLRFKSDDKIRIHLYLRTIWFCKVNINKINTFFKQSNAITNYIQNKSDINKLVNNYKSVEEV